MLSLFTKLQMLRFTNASIYKCFDYKCFDLQMLRFANASITNASIYHEYHSTYYFLGSFQNDGHFQSFWTFCLKPYFTQQLFVWTFCLVMLQVILRESFTTKKEKLAIFLKISILSVLKNLTKLIRYKQLSPLFQLFRRLNGRQSFRLKASFTQAPFHWNS